ALAAAVSRVHADLARRVIELRKTQRLGQPARGVDGEHYGPATMLLSRAERERRGGGRLSHAAGAATHDDPDIGIGEERVHIETLLGFDVDHVGHWLLAAAFAGRVRRTACSLPIRTPARS